MILYSLDPFGVIVPSELHHSQKYTSAVCDACCDNRESHSSEEIETLSMLCVKLFQRLMKSMAVYYHNAGGKAAQ